MRFPRSKRSRRAASEVMGAVLMMAVTLTVGFAVWAWASGSATASERNFGNGIAANINCLNENYVIVNAGFSSGNSKQVTLWLYNSGNITIVISTLQISNSTWSYNSPSGTVLTIKPNFINSTTISNVGSPFTPGKMYTFKTVARCQGTLVQTYQQVR